MSYTPRSARRALARAGLIAGAIGLALLGGWSLWHARTLVMDPISELQAAAPSPADGPPLSSPAALAADPCTRARRAMVEDQLRSRDITNAKVLEVMGRLPRHRFVPDNLQNRAYEDHPLPIGHDQTISQPYIVALMTQLAAPKPGDRALDIGTGSGYQAAVLAELCKEVSSIEIVAPLAEQARKRLAGMGYKNIEVRSGDGYRGWKEHAPFDVIVVAASPDHVPQPLIDQLALGGRLVIPVGDYPQHLVLLTKQPDGKIVRKLIAPVMFVPMTGEAQRRKG